MKQTAFLLYRIFFFISLLSGGYLYGQTAFFSVAASPIAIRLAAYPFGITGKSSFGQESFTCDAPTNLQVTGITNSGAIIGWHPSGAAGYEYALSTSATPPASGMLLLGSTTEFVSGLASATNYYLHVRSHCGASVSAWVTSDPFRTAQAPTGLITWVPSGQLNYGVNPFVPTTADSRLTITGLTRGSAVSTDHGSVKAAANAWGGYGWQGATDQDISFSVTANPGFKLSLSSLQISYRVSGTGPASGSLSYAINNGSFVPVTTLTFISNTAGNSIPAVNLQAIGALQDLPAGTVVTFRLAPTGGSTTGTWYIYNEGLLVNGVVSSNIPVPALLPASAIHPACFTANWLPVAGASHYLVDVLTDGFSTDTAATVLAGWDFAAGLTSKAGTVENLNLPLVTNASGLTVSANETARADGWDNGNGSKYWEVVISTLNYFNIRISSVQRSSASGPKHFTLQYKTSAAGTYSNVPGGAITVANDYTSGVLLQLLLPPECGNKATVYLRWLMSSTTAVGGGVVTTLGTSNIDNVLLTGNRGLETQFVAGYQNRPVGLVTSVPVTGLQPNSRYTYVVRAVVGGVTSGSSVAGSTTTTDYTMADYRSRQSGSYQDAATWEYDPGCNGTWVPANTAPGTGNNVSISGGHTVQFTQTVLLATGKTLRVQNGGQLTTGIFRLEGGGDFQLLAGGILSIGSPDGIAAAGATGNIQVSGNRIFSTGAHFVYAGTGSQVTGSGLPALAKSLTLQNTGGHVALSANLEIQDRLQFITGNLVTHTFTVRLSAGATIAASAGTGWVAGRLQKLLPAASPAAVFEIGDATGYRPLSLSFAYPTAAGLLTACVAQADGEHPQGVAAGVLPNKKLHRYFTLETANGFSTGGAFDLKFQYAATDYDSGADPYRFVVRQFDGSRWSNLTPVVNSGLASKATVSHLAAQNDFVLGECAVPDASDLRLATVPVCPGRGAAITLCSATLPPGVYALTYGLSAPNEAQQLKTTVFLSGTDTVRGQFTTDVLSASGRTLFTLREIVPDGSLQCSPMLAGNATLSLQVYTPSAGPVTITASNGTTICAGVSTLLTAQAAVEGNGAAYHWQTSAADPVVAQSISFQEPATSTYYVQVKGLCNELPPTPVLLTVSHQNQWTGAVNSSWQNPGNWSCNIAPLGSHDVRVPFAANQPVLEADAAVQQLWLAPSATLALNHHQLTVQGGVTGGGSFTGSPASSLLLGGGATALRFNQQANGSSNALGSLTIFGGSTTLAGRLHLYQLLYLAGGTLDLAGEPLVLRSTAAGTARVAEIKGLLRGETAVTVERYVSALASRRWRLLTAPVKSATIWAAWQEASAWNGVIPENSTGYGTLITGLQQGSAAAANTNGFDFWPSIANANASVRRYQGAANNSDAAWLPLTSTRTHNFNAAAAYLVFIRGDRSVSTGTAAGATTLRASGTLNAGDQTIPLYGSSRQSHTLVGNPYAAPLNFNSFYQDHSDLLKNRYWLVNAGLGNGFGAYQLVTGNASGRYDVVPLDFTLPDDENALAALAIIASGSGFFVEPATSSDASLQIRERHKAEEAPLVNVFKKQDHSPAKLYINLCEQDRASGRKTLLDGVLLNGAGDRPVSLDDDVPKVVNAAENLALHIQLRNYSVATVNMRAGDTVALRLWNTAAKTYQIELKGKNMEGASFAVFLLDKLTGTKTSVSLRPDSITVVSLPLLTDTASAQTGRFVLVFESRLVPLPLIFTSLQAQEKQGKVYLSWTVAGEVQGFGVERSADGGRFVSLATLPAGRSFYTDTATQARNYYRIKAVGPDGELVYSPTVNTVLQPRQPFFVLTPNPASRRIYLRHSGAPAGLYVFQINTASGQRVLEGQFRLRSGSGTEAIEIGKALPAGSYLLQLSGVQSTPVCLPFQIVP